MMILLWVALMVTIVQGLTLLREHRRRLDWQDVAREWEAEASALYRRLEDAQNPGLANRRAMQAQMMQQSQQIRFQNCMMYESQRGADAAAAGIAGLYTFGLGGFLGRGLL